MSGSPSRSSPANTQPNYILLPNSSQQKPVQLIQGLDGTMYATFSPLTGSVTATPTTSGVTQLAPGAMVTMIPPQGLHLTSPAALTTATAVAAGSQLNTGAFAAATALQGQNPTPFPFIPIYTPFSVPSSLNQTPALSLQSVPIPFLGESISGTHPYLLPHQAQSSSSSTSPEKRSPSVQTFPVPGEKMLMPFVTRTTKSGSTSSSTSECSQLPIISKAVTEHSMGVWGKDTSSSTVLMMTKELTSPTLAASNYAGGLNLTHKTDALQDQVKRSTQGTLQASSTEPDRTRSEEARTERNLVPGLCNVKSLSSLSRYVNQVAHQNQQTERAATNALSLEKLLQTNNKSKATSSISMQGTSVESDHSILALIKEEPHLLQFYDLFSKSQLSGHLRVRTLTTEGGDNVLKWIEVTRTSSHIEPSFGPVDAARILISSNGLCKLQLMFPYTKTLSTRFVPTTMSQADELFSELSPKHVICPGLPDCETKLNTLGYQPTNIRVVETPSMKRYDHEKCPIWHISVPCNLYSESGQILHHMCKQCKNLLSTLNKTITKIAGLNIGAMSRNTERGVSFDLAMLTPSGSGLSSPYLLRSTLNKSGEEEGSAERQRHKRKRKPHPKDDESSDSGKSVATLPAIYQLLQADPTSKAGQIPHASVLASNECSTAETTAVSRGIAMSATDHNSDLSVPPSSVIVQTKTKAHEWQLASPIKDRAYIEVQSTAALDNYDLEPESETEQDEEQNGMPTVDKAQQLDGVTIPPARSQHSKNEEVERADVQIPPATSQELSTDFEDSSDADIIKKRKLS